MPKNLWFIAMLHLTSMLASGQTSPFNRINLTNTGSLGLEPLRVLASDEMMGRGTTRPEIHIAARYIAEQFRAVGLKEVPGTSDYFQTFTIRMITAGKSGSFHVGDSAFAFGKDWIQMNGQDFTLNAPLVYLHHGSKEEFQRADLAGKIVLTDMGSSDSSNFTEGYYLEDEKQKWAKAKGAIALIERFKKAEIAWPLLIQFAATERPSIDEEGSILPVMIVNDEANILRGISSGKNVSASISNSGAVIKRVFAKNVMGWIEGTDPILKKEFILLSAHYDHIGVAAKPQMQEGKLDSIYNGARDNAIGSTAVIDAARYFSKYPPKRSVLFITYTGEEIGLIGSRYLAAHPLIPFDKIKYDLNIDNASYNDTTIVSVIGLGRTSAEKHLRQACKEYGLTAHDDPAPDQNLFDRSDNVSLAALGIPAPTFALGMTKFDAEVQKRYHQLSDEVGNFNLRYAMKYVNSYILAASYIANDPSQPAWIKGDKYEAAWKSLYKK